MDSKERERLRLSASHLLALADGVQEWEAITTMNVWVRAKPSDAELFAAPDFWRPVRQADDVCAWCGHDHDIGVGHDHEFVSTLTHGPRPTPPEGWELLAPDVPLVPQCDFYYWRGSWNPIATVNVSGKCWRARRVAAKPDIVSDHEMLVAVLRCYDGISGEKYAEIRKRFLAQEGGKHV